MPKLRVSQAIVCYPFLRNESFAELLKALQPTKSKLFSDETRILRNLGLTLPLVLFAATLYNAQNDRSDRLWEDANLQQQSPCAFLLLLFGK